MAAVRDTNDLVADAARRAALPAAAIAAARLEAEALMNELAARYIASHDPGDAPRIEHALSELGRALDHAEPHFDAPSFRTRERIARGAAHRALTPERLRELKPWAELAGTAVGRALRTTALGALIARVEELTASAERTLLLPFVAAMPSLERIDQLRQRELQAFALRRLRDALAVALLEAEPVRADSRPLLRCLLALSLDHAERTLDDIDAWLLRARPQPAKAPRAEEIPHLVCAALRFARTRAANRGDSGIPADLLKRELANVGLEMDHPSVVQALEALAPRRD